MLGRAKKGRLAFAMATFIAGRRFGLDPQQLVTEGLRRLKDVPQVAELNERIRGELLDAGRQALAATVDQRLADLAESLHDRRLRLGVKGDEEEEEGEEEEEFEEGPEGEGEEEEPEEEEEEPEEEEKEPEEEALPRRRRAPSKKAARAAPRKSAAKRPERKPAKKAAQPAKRAPAKKAPAKKTATRRR
ncbi:hypothetical protein [Streptomyces atratus]|uniref:hypothetical protein n=1 Tax=Streptomyces atratus TaxID=1893 RepID=UPI0033EA5922